MDTTDTNLFTMTLKATLTPAYCIEKKILQLNNMPQTRDLLDQLVEEITRNISTALTSSTKMTTGRTTGQPWWNKACKTAAQYHIQARS